VNCVVIGLNFLLFFLLDGMFSTPASRTVSGRSLFHLSRKHYLSVVNCVAIGLNFCYLSFYWMVCLVLLLLELYLGDYCSTPVENNHQFHPLRHRGKQPGKDFSKHCVFLENSQTLSMIIFVEFFLLHSAQFPECFFYY
jgi:hypothetical protein